MHPTQPAFIQLEVSGFLGRRYPIEVSFALPEMMYCAWIPPAAHWQGWDEKAQTVHLITRNVLLSHGELTTEVAQSLTPGLRRLTSFSDA